MSKPVVAIVGRPNVGKSTLFNALAGDNISIVKDTPGVTRDRIYADVTWLDRTFTLIDTGGIEPDSSDIILSRMREQAQIAIDTADVIIFITDVRQGLVDSDAKVADMLRRSGKPVRLVVNKVDSHQKYMMDVYEFYNLGIGEPIPISAANRQGLGDMLDEVIKEFPVKSEEEDQDDIPKIAIVGKPNVGKSSLMNGLLKETRAIVTDIPGTTRDTIEEVLSIRNIPVYLVDTAGIRETSDKVEKMGIEKSKEAFNQADFILFLLDGSRPLEEEDLQIMELLGERKSLVLINKRDLGEAISIEEIAAKLPASQVIEASLLKGQGITEIEDAVEDLVYGGEITQKESMMVNNVRHIELLQQAVKSLNDALHMSEMREALDFIEVDVKNAYERLGEIIGETVSDDIINEVFARFCLGK